MEQWKLTLGYYDRLLADEPGSADAQRNVALVEKYVGSGLPPEESAPHLKRAVELDEARLAAAPDNRQAQLDTAISLAGLARVLESKGDLEESGRLYDRSVEIRRRIADTDRADVRAAGLLGSALIDAARVQREMRAVAAARARAGEAVKILEDVLRATNDHWTEMRLANAWLELGRADGAAGDRSASCRALRRASDMYRALASEDVEPGLKAAATREAAACQ